MATKFNVLVAKILVSTKVHFTKWLPMPLHTEGQSAMRNVTIMAKLILITSYLLFIVFSWGMQAFAMGIEIPESDISMGVYDSVAPRLQLELSNKGLQLGSPIFIRIFKKSEKLELWVQKKTEFVLFKTYRICDFSGFLGPKLEEGDKQSPEGFYSVGIDQINPWSNYHLSFNLGYPNEYDIVHNRSGSALMVHGHCSSVGCYAMTDYRMNEIYTIAACALQSGQQFFGVHIFPFHMTWENLASYRRSEWLGFWENLKEGYDFFLDYGLPPHIGVNNNRYVFFDPTASRISTLQPIADKLVRLTQLEKKPRALSSKK